MFTRSCILHVHRHHLAGRHVLTKSTHFFAGFLSMSHQVMGISEIYSMTSDNLGIKVSDHAAEGVERVSSRSVKKGASKPRL